MVVLVLGASGTSTMPRIALLRLVLPTTHVQSHFHKLDGLQQICVLSKFWGREMSIQCQQAWFLLRAMRENLIPASLSLCQFLVVIDNPRYSLSCRCITPISTSLISQLLSPCFSVSSHGILFSMSLSLYGYQSY